MSKNQKRNTTSAVWEIAEPIAKDLGLKIWDIRFVKEGSMWYLRIFIDKPDGITIEDCENMSRAIDKPLDEADPINVSYCLEVCSPGIERELTRDEHFEQFIGQKVMVKFIRPIKSGQKEINGILKEYSNGNITIISYDDEELSFSKKDTVYVKLDDFNN